MGFSKWLWAAPAALALLHPPESPAAPEAVASIVPVHALAAAVMEGVGTPHLLLPPGASPHTYRMRPSDRAALERADTVFWTGPALETALRPVADAERWLALLDSDDLSLLPARSAGVWHGRSVPERAPDPHIWLDPDNARAMAAAMAAALAERLERLDREIAVLLAPVRERHYAVFHDAYRYFEAHYAPSPIGALTVAFGRPTGPRRLAALRRAGSPHCTALAATGAACLFVEPQFTLGLAETATEGSDIRLAELGSPSWTRSADRPTPISAPCARTRRPLPTACHPASLSRWSHAKKAVASRAPAICAAMKAGASARRMPAKLSVNVRARVTAGFANEVDDVNQ